MTIFAQLMSEIKMKCIFNWIKDIEESDSIFVRNEKSNFIFVLSNQSLLDDVTASDFEK
jgi:hypothetical protein